MMFRLLSIASTWTQCSQLACMPAHSTQQLQQAATHDARDVAGVGGDAAVKVVRADHTALGKDEEQALLQVASQVVEAKIHLSQPGQAQGNRHRP